MKFSDFLKKHIVLFDGAFGTLLQKKAGNVGTLPERLNEERPELIADIHRAYLDAGADVITANTFGANPLKAGSKELSDRLIRAGVALARKIAKDKFVALDIGPSGRLLEPMGSMTFEEAYQCFADVVDAGKEGADLILIETMADLQEMRAALLAAREHSDLPVLCSMTFEENGRTFAGCDPLCYAMTCAPLADAVGVNCSLGPAKLLPVVRAILSATDKPVIVQANAGLPDADLNYDVSAEEFAEVYRTLSGRRRADHRRVLRHDARIYPPAARPCRRARSAKEKRPPPLLRVFGDARRVCGRRARDRRTHQSHGQKGDEAGAAERRLRLRADAGDRTDGRGRGHPGRQCGAPRAG